MNAAEIIEFDERYSRRFADLNYQWIAETYGIEPPDRELLDHPTSIITAGGQIFFAVVNGEAAATAALIPMGDNDLELTKMAVDPAFRGQGIGDQLMKACIDYSQRRDVGSIILESNTKQEAAIRLYRKFGFHEIPLDLDSQYVRANIRMELAIGRANR
jgi:ribosomal protein S18 acetylase RimI-like enzyme